MLVHTSLCVITETVCGEEYAHETERGVLLVLGAQRHSLGTIFKIPVEPTDE